MFEKIKHKIIKLLDGEKGRVLMLHRVCKDKSILEENRKLEVTPERLEETLRFYKNKHYDFISVDKAVQRISSSKKGKKFLCITLDDGYADNYEIAYPIFKKYNCPFAISLTIDFFEKKLFLWWYILEDLIVNNERLELTDGSIYNTSTITEKNEAFVEIRKKIFNLPHNTIQPTFEQWFAYYEYSNHLEMALSIDRIKQLSKEPLCSFVSHTMTHPFLPKLSYEQQYSELEVSKKKIEEITGREILFIAYPYGVYNLETTKIMKKIGYKAGLVTHGGKITNKDHDTFHIKRSELH